MIVLDTSGLWSAIDGSQRHHRAAAETLRRAEPPYLLSPFVLAELDYLLTTRVSHDSARALLGEVERGAYQLESFGREDLALALTVIDRYRELGPGLADASIVVIAARHGTTDILTLDERHFRAVSGLDGRPFRLLPADLAT